MMDLSITDINDVRKEIQVTAYADDLVPHFEKAYKEKLPKIEIKGFRKGRVPLDLVKKLHGEAIEHDSLDSIVNDVYRQVVQERNIQPIGDPVLTKMDYRRGEALTFKITYEIAPVFELGEYKGISVEKPVHKVTDAEVENEILRLRRSDSTMSEVPEAADDEHVLTVDIQETDPAGSPLIGRKTSDARLHLAHETIYADIKAAFTNASTRMTHQATHTKENKDKEQASFMQIYVNDIATFK